jgi:hypothetical protein
MEKVLVMSLIFLAPEIFQNVCSRSEAEINPVKSGWNFVSSAMCAWVMMFCFNH